MNITSRSISRFFIICIAREAGDDSASAASSVRATKTPPSGPGGLSWVGSGRRHCRLQASGAGAAMAIEQRHRHIQLAALV
jgi:hypothetical protein